MKAKEVLDVKVEGYGTVRDYLKALLKALWLEGESFSGKRPLGDSGWEYDLYTALADAGAVQVDKDGYGDYDFSWRDEQIMNKLILKAIKKL